MARRGLTPFGRRVHKRMIDLNITHSELSPGGSDAASRT